jgi:hypothetical protein
MASCEASWYLEGVPRTARTRSLPAQPANTGKHPLKRTRSKAEDRAVERLRRICLALPGVTEKIAWGELTWRVGKIFAQMDTHHHGAEHVAVWLALPPGLQEALVAEDPVRFFRPPTSVTRVGWAFGSTAGRTGIRSPASYATLTISGRRRRPCGVHAALRSNRRHKRTRERWNTSPRDGFDPETRSLGSDIA